MNRRINKRSIRTTAALLAGAVFAGSFAPGQIAAYADYAVVGSGSIVSGGTQTDNAVIGAAPGSISTEISSPAGNITINSATGNGVVINSSSSGSGAVSTGNTVSDRAVITSAGNSSAGSGTASTGSSGYAVVGGGSAGYAGISGGTGVIGPAATIGPGGSTASGIDTTSPDWSDYKETGGTAQGALSIRTTIPSGCIDSCALEVSNPIVKNADKYSYDYMMNDLGLLQQRYGKYMTHHSLGTTVDGRNIEEVILGSQSAPTHILITGAIHGREYITANLVMKQIEYIVAYASNGCFDGQRLALWLEDVCLHFVPMINPDGVAISQYGTAGLRNQSLVSVLEQAYANDVALQRTTLDFASYLVRWKANAHGVNLNDNFNALTGGIQYRTDQPSADIYYGQPGSEPETKAIQQLIDGRHFKAIINYHATGSVIYWDFTENRLREHARDLANNIRTISSYTMQLTGQEGGSVKAYAGTRANPSTCITVEVGISQCPVNPAEMDVIWAQNKFVPFYTMKWAKEKGK